MSLQLPTAARKATVDAIASIADGSSVSVESHRDGIWLVVRPASNPNAEPHIRLNLTRGLSVGQEIRLPGCSAYQLLKSILKVA